MQSRSNKDGGLLDLRIIYYKDELVMIKVRDQDPIRNVYTSIIRLSGY